MNGSATPAVRISTRGWCGSCVSAGRLLAKLGIDFEEIILDDKPELYRSLSKANRSWPTLPTIFVDENSVGGATHLASVYRRGEFAFLLDEGPG